MPKRPIETRGAPAPSGAYSQAIVAGDFMFLSGQGPFDSEGNLVGESFADQARQTFANLAAIAAEGGKTLADAVRVGVYLSDMDTFEEMNAIYRQTFPEPLPARTTIQTQLPGFGIEVDVVLYLGE